MNCKRCLALLSAAVFSVPASAETTQCTPITALPAVIDQQGIYCLTGNLSTNQTSGFAIEITANNVTLDLNGWKLGGLAAGTATSAHGIDIHAENVTVQNGIVRGFETGVDIVGHRAVVRDLLVDQNRVIGIVVGGLDSLVERNQVVATGGHDTTHAIVNPTGIYVLSFRAKVSGNLISGLIGGSEREIGITTGSGSLIENNFVTDDGPSTAGVQTVGIIVPDTARDVVIRNNTIANFEEGITYHQTGFTPTGIYANNTAMGCATAFAGAGTDGGGNASN